MARQPDIQYINAYVSGTTAYKVEQPKLKKPRVRLPKPKKQTAYVIPVDLVAVVGAAVALLMMVCLIVGGLQLAMARSDTRILENHVASLRESNELLRQTYSESYDLEEIRQIATAMGMVPVSQVPSLEIEVQLPQQEEPVSPWKSFWTFVAEMFA